MTPEQMDRRRRRERDRKAYAYLTDRPRWASTFADDVDVVVVERLMAGENVSHSMFERRAAARRLRDRGETLNRIAGLLRITNRQVCRDLKHTET